MTRTDSLYGSREIVIESDGDDLATALDSKRLHRLLDDHGVILLRGFRHDVDRFSDLVQRCSSRVTLDPARRFTGRNAQLVDAGLDEVGLHLENGNAPFLPEVIWFYCEVAAAKGSQTTVCDGEAAIDEIAPDCAAAFRERPISYERTVPGERWRRYVSHELGLAGGPESATPAHLEQIESMVPGLSFELNEDGSLKYRFRTRAVHPSRFSRNPAFANSLLGPSNNYEHPVIRFADGGKIPNAMWTDIEAATDRVTRDVDWCSGDVAIIDNTRYMHGRRRIEDPARMIHNAQSYL
ncbi:MAG: TauD/TfdA family dioxygenase [Halofilum sp. (in: g-proteobacteria)]|nr:TauD/TfdA family dioxygenase [Halofilum sp. (in: g-proteobacteria)]